MHPGSGSGVSGGAPRSTQRVPRGAREVNGGKGGEADPRPQRKNQVRHPPRKPEAVSRIRIKTHQDSQRHQVPGGTLAEELHPAQHRPEDEWHYRVRKGLLQAYEQQRLRKDNGECQEPGGHPTGH